MTGYDVSLDLRHITVWLDSDMKDYFDLFEEPDNFSLHTFSHDSDSEAGRLIELFSQFALHATPKTSPEKN